MAQANNEMLEDALRRDSVRARNVGWGRLAVSPTIHPPQGQEGKFFKFRFGNTTPSSSSGVASPNGVYPSHLSSASLPSLSSSKDEEIEKLTLELTKQKRECQTALEEKKKVEDELESLSQALFEEANNMVAQERMKAADLEAELREFASEREAMKLAMKILEEENQRFRSVLASASQVVRHVKSATPTQRLTPSPSRNHSRNSSKSSSLSIPIASSTPGSPRASPQYLTPAETSPPVGNIAYPLTTDSAEHAETVQPRLTRSPPPPLEVDGWPDSPDTPYYATLPSTAEPDEGETTARLTTQ